MRWSGCFEIPFEKTPWRKTNQCSQCNNASYNAHTLKMHTGKRKRLKSKSIIYSCVQLSLVACTIDELYFKISISKYEFLFQTLSPQILKLWAYAPLASHNPWETLRTFCKFQTFFCGLITTNRKWAKSAVCFRQKTRSFQHNFGPRCCWCWLIFMAIYIV